MKAAKILGGILLGLFGLVVLLYLAGLAINWNDQPPSPEALAFQRLIDERPQVPDAENAYVYLLGFAAPEGQDPAAVGTRRMAWIANTDWSNRGQPDPTGQQLELRSDASSAIAAFDKACRDDDRRPCAEAFRALAGAWQPDAMETLVLQRYHTLLTYRAWREVIPLHVAAPIPPYSEITHAQRLHLLSLLQAAKRGDAEAVRDGLNADSLYWRSAADHAQSLIGQMIAVAGIRNHYFFGNLVLATLPAEKIAAAVPADWQREFSPDERSMRLVMASELAMTQRTLRESLDESTWDEFEQDSTWLESTFNRLSVPFLQVQDTLNDTAAAYERLCDAFDVPLSRYAEAEKTLRAAHRGATWFAVYNPIGKFLHQLSAPDNFIQYLYRTGSTEGMRRAAVLVAQLRTRAVTADQAATEVANATLRDPYTDSAFEWDEKRRSVVFTGPEEHMWRRHEFFY